MTAGIYDVISFTGTRDGMTAEQIQTVRLLLLNYAPSEVHHGDCVGADVQFHGLCRALFGKSVEIHVHPPEDGTLRAFTDGDVVYDPKPYLERDLDIARAGELLIATPKQAVEVRRSGTWTTIRYAKKAKKVVAVVTPAGHTRRGGSGAR